jgi:hypothetical protein
MRTLLLVSMLAVGATVRGQWREDTLQVLADRILNGRDAADRFRADSAFTRTLVRALRTPHSFRHPFDSLTTISRVYAPDSSFRLLTWQVVRDEQVFRRHGAIQLRTTDGSLKLFPLIDRGSLIRRQADTVTNHEWWIGALYYRIIKTSHAGRHYYTLLGYDEHSLRSTRKVLDVLTFDPQGRPVFGAPVFALPRREGWLPLQTRFWIEFKKAGNARLQYDDEMGMILFEHLVSESNDPDKPWTFIPDGDYEGFKWVNGRWVYVEKVFNQKLKDGEAPVVAPVKGNKFKG